jgi:hypothetical protein
MMVAFEDGDGSAVDGSQAERSGRNGSRRTEQRRQSGRFTVAQRSLIGNDVKQQG